jgi:uncharacterized protein
VTAGDPVVRDAPERDRYEALKDGEVAAFSRYLRADLSSYGRSETLLIFTHTEVEPDYEGQGVGGALVRGALDDVRRRRALVLARCPFVRAWIERHPEYQDLVWEPPPSRVAD